MNREEGGGRAPGPGEKPAEGGPAGDGGGQAGGGQRAWTSDRRKSFPGSRGQKGLRQQGREPIGWNGRV